MQVKISVRNLIEFVMRTGDIDNRFRDNNRMVAGIKAHQKVQKSYNENYQSEYYLKNTTQIGDMVFKVEGRADGLLKNGDSYTIDEIKSTTRNLDDLDDSNKLHWAQAMCYAYFFSIKKDLKEIFISLTYVSLEDYKTKQFKKSFTFEQLHDFYMALLEAYINFSKILALNLEKRNKTSRKLTFPYKGYRKGQRKMAVAVYTALLEKKKLFVDAPTGTGKTISTLFPGVKSFGEGLADKIFYLTAKNTTAKEALKAISILKEKHLYIKAVAITSKEKICLNDQVKCNPIDCPFAKGHFDRVNDALKDILSNEELMDYDIITSYAEKYRVCPLEFELDIASYADIIICDYNYVFNPSVYLRRFFDDIVENYIFLIDEAHNLLDRARDMYSFKLEKNNFEQIKTYFDPKKDKYIIEKLDQILESFEEIYQRYGKKLFYYQEDQIDDFDKKLISLAKSLEKILIKERDHKFYDQIQDLYFEINKYMKVSDNYCHGFYSTMTYKPDSMEKSFEIKCIDPSEVLKNKYACAISTIFFSATLSPMNFYMKVLGASDSLKLHLPLAFDEKNFMILNSGISTRYKDRYNNLMDISDLIHDFVNTKEGNYFIFFPSYSYMEDLYEDYKSRYTDDVIVQEKIMNQKQRHDFLQEFTYESKKIGFLVLGGIFSEGVDLKGERLIGTMIISVGMPGVSDDRNLIKHHFDKYDKMGFDYSYTYPGINKVFQAAGRVIRTETDKGIIYLLDDRFLWDKYRKLYPRHWKNIIEISSKEQLRDITNKFWKEDKSEEK
ncbi:MAG: ATP-dependent DNA helicase [Peptoniphilaceae bacterium]|nr:ATP-dependent DNA helicase [Peptoniphilaceae bacterium]MDY6018468.1 ATP-dependent DNA helicase [Anaerococcus sp.]